MASKEKVYFYNPITELRISGSKDNKFMLIKPLNKSALILVFSIILGLNPKFAGGKDGQQFTVFHYNSTAFKGGSQHWEISKDASERVFVATNNGVLMMDGTIPRMLTMPDKTIVRSVQCFDNKVYVGAYQEFGFWQENEIGQWNYLSLTETVDKSLFQHDEFWKIVHHENKIYFQSFGNIFCYDGQTVSRIDLPGPILFLLKSGEKVFTQAINGPLYELKNDKLHRLAGSEIFSTTEVKAVLSPSKNKFVIGTSSLGLYKYDGKSFVPWEVEANSQLREYKINAGVLLNDALVFGTILKGIFILDGEGKIIHQINSLHGLQNNTVLSMVPDENNNLWLGLDKGFDFIWFHSPVSLYTGDETGTTYTSALYQNKLYVGTNQGIFYYKQLDQKGFAEPKFIQGSQGQVWFLKVLNGRLYCGLNNGTYLVDDDQLIRVSSINGGYNLKPFRLGDEEILLQSTYNEIVVFKNDDGKWRFHHGLKGFSAPARFLEIDHLGNMILGHSITGLYLLKANPSFDSVSAIHLLGEKEGLPVKSNRVFKVDNRIVVPTGQKLYQWNAIAERFEAWDALNSQLGTFMTAETIISTGLNQYWFIKNDEIGLFEIRHETAKILHRIIPEMYDLQIVNRNESIVNIQNEQFIIGLEEGFAVLDLNELRDLQNNDSPPLIRVTEHSSTPGSDSKELKIKEMDNTRLSAQSNNLSFSFALPEMAGLPCYYQYYLEGIDPDWSGWQTGNLVSYSRLPHGNYTFHVRGLNARGMPTETASFGFNIRPPWYLTSYAYALYLLMATTFVYLLWHSYRRRQWVRQEKALKQENERMKVKNSQAEAELIKLSNEKLHSEITMKNMELAKNTMAMIKKNELLIEIRHELNRQKEELGGRLPVKYYTKISKLIESSINSEHDWEMFEYLFDQAHENFFKRLKQNYPELTPSDFRLCAYLRMNLTSKEIAPLLNITIRGIEEKRYRLRKKLNLQTDQNLTEFIINF